MTNEPQISREPGPNEHDPALVARELGTFQSVLALPLTRERLDFWIKDSAVRYDLMANTVWGTIRWRKSIGRPIAPTVAEAFVIEHGSWQYKKEFVDGAVRWIELLVPHPEPSKRDGPDDEDYYRVTFMADAPQLNGYVRVRFAAHVGWEHRIQIIAGYRAIDPPERTFSKGRTGIVLDPFEVVRGPFSLWRD